MTVFLCMLISGKFTNLKESSLKICKVCEIEKEDTAYRHGNRICRACQYQRDKLTYKNKLATADTDQTAHAPLNLTPNPVRCISCGVARPPESFRHRYDTPGARRNTCNICMNARQQSRREATPQERQSNKAYKPVKSAEQRAPGMPADKTLLRVMELVRRPINFSVLCDRLDMSPARVKKLLETAAAQNAPIHVEHDTISIAPVKALDQIHELSISKAVGGVYKIGALSDTHLGSKYCMRGAIRETVQWLYDQGVRDIVHSGDVLEGCYRHAQYELSHQGFDRQMDDAAKCFPRLPGLAYHFITGNHDYTFEEKIGMRAGIAIEEAFKARGRTDWKCYGDRNAYLKINNAVINLWHPRGSPAYARTYVLQKRIEAFTAIKPQILLMGHYHQFGYVYERGVHGIGMPAFQGSGSNFAQSLRGPPSLGGLMLSWQMNEAGHIHHFGLTPRFYYEKEDLFTHENVLDATGITGPGRDQRYRKARQA